jgi:hypothetical protein
LRSFTTEGAEGAEREKRSKEARKQGSKDEQKLELLDEI